MQAKLILVIEGRSPHRIRGKKIYLARINKGWSQLQVAQKIGVSQQTFSRFEQDANIDSILAESIEQILDLSLTCFYDKKIDNIFSLTLEAETWELIRGKKIYLARLSREWRQKDLAAMLRISQQSLSRYERGSAIDEKTIVKLEQIFNLSL